MKKYALFLSLLSTTSALDLVFDKLQCETTLPAYAEDDGITMTCNGSNRCSLGENALISGDLIYQGLVNSGVRNTTGYVSARLNLMTIDYQLFHLLPFNFCGDWVAYSHNNAEACPGDGYYHFSIPYQLPENDDITTWFATGWEGVSYLKIYASQSEQSTKVAHCKIHFKTFVTGSNEENWYTLPSAAQTTIVLFAILGALFLGCMCLACRPSGKHPTDEDYSSEFKAMEDPIEASRKETPPPQKKVLDEEKGNLDETVSRLSLAMNYAK